MKISYKYLFIIILAVFLLAPVKNTFAKVTCGNGDTPSCASCGSSLYTRKEVPCSGTYGGWGKQCWDPVYAGTCGQVVCGGNCTNRYAQMVPSAETIKNFYDSYYTSVNPWWNGIMSSLTNGYTGREVSSLSIILEGFGFALPIVKSDTGVIVIDSSYSSLTGQAVSELQKAFKLLVTGNFDLLIKQDFENFYADVSSSFFATPIQDMTKFAIIYPGGVTSFFNGSKFDKPSSIVNSFAVTEPTFMMQDSKGKNYFYKNDKWNLTTTVFPTPKAPTTTGVPIKGNLVSVSSVLSTIGSQITSNFATARTVSSGSTNATVVPSILNFLYSTGFSTYKPISTATTFGDVSTNATKAFQNAVGMSPTGIFDNSVASAAKNLNDQIISAINSTSLPPNVDGFFVAYPNSFVSKFDPSTGAFSTPLPIVDLDPYANLTSVSPNPPSDPLAKPWHIICCAFGKCKWRCGLGDGYWF